MIIKKEGKRYFVAGFDSNYLAKAVTCFISLSNHHNNFEIHAFCFDDLSYNVIKKLNTKNLIPYKQSDFETKELAKAKIGKTKLYEYYWACKPFLIRKVMDEQNADMVTYIDADFMFFDSPENIFQEISNADVLIQPNNFSSEEVKQFMPVGYYCTCYETFRNTPNGREILNWWHRKDMEWCLAEFKPGLFADQKYLDDWRVRFKNVKENSVVGANIAPWNMQRYDFSLKKRKIYVNSSPLIYFHYHSFKINLITLDYMITGDRNNYYRITKNAEKIVYPPYVKLIKSVIRKLKKIPEYNKYAMEYPESNIKLVDEKSVAKFASYLEAKGS